MRKLVTLALLLAAAVAQGAPIDREAAGRVAREFLAGRAATTTRHNIRAVAPKDEAAPSQWAPYYVFNIGLADGFVIVSGDDLTPAVMGYADSGTFDEATMPEPMRLWLAARAEEVRWLQTQAASPMTKVRRAEAAVSTKAFVPTLLQTTWNQGYPYNAMCPTSGTTQCVTGCVATALAQVLKFHEWPIRPLTTNIPTYTPESGSLAGNAIAAGTLFDWAKMRPAYNSSETLGDGSEEAVAQLMLACGVAVEMAYGTGASSASLAKAAPALKTYFDYGSTVKYIDRDDYEYAEWQDVIYHEVANGRPVLYGGSSSGGGHAFVIDGYDGAGFYHVNWGWGGSSDGYYALSVLNPYNSSGIGASSSRDGYGFNQDAIIGIWPNNGKPFAGDSGSGEDAAACLTTLKFSASSTTITFQFQNKTGAEAAFDAGIGYVDAQGQVQMLTQRYYNSTLPDGYFWYEDSRDITASLFTNAGLGNGSYKLVPASRVSTASTWTTDFDIDKQYILAEVSGGTVTLTEHGMAEPRLSLEGQHVVGTATAGKAFELLLDINSSDAEFYGELMLVKDGTTMYSASGITIGEGQTRPVSFFLSGLPAGETTLALCIGNGRNAIVSQVANVTFTVAPASSATYADLSLTELHYNDGTTVPGTVVRGYFTVRNNHSTDTFDDDIYLIWYYNSTPSTSTSYASGSHEPYHVTIPAGQEVRIDFASADKNVGWKYWPMLYALTFNGQYYQYQQISGIQTSICTITSGITLYLTDGTTAAADIASTLNLAANVAAADLTGINGITTVNAANPNTLIIIGATDNAPTAATNIVRDGVCDMLTLTDGHPFYTPIDFTATQATYLRTFGSGYGRSGGGWSTLCLPFAVESVSAEYQGQYYPIDWFHTDADEGKHFWVMDFAYEEDGTAHFAHARKLKANTPHIIAVPNAEWGSGADLTATPMLFAGSNAAIAASAPTTVMGQRFRMFGSYATSTMTESYYALNAAGSHFDLVSSGQTEPFRCYFLSNEGYYYDVMNIGIVGGTANAIATLQTPATAMPATTDATAIYDLCGRRVGTIGQTGTLRHGIYVVAGKKVKL